MTTEEMLAKATPRPWMLSRDEEGDTHFIARHGWGGGGPNYYSNVDYPQDEADGQLVVLAVNNFERMRHALTRVRECSGGPCATCLEEIEAALDASEPA